MPAPNANQSIQELPLKIVGGTHFGRYPKISDEQTWNMIISDGFLVPYAGYKNVLSLGGDQVGRGIYSSYRANKMFVVIGSQLYQVNTNLQATPIGDPIGTNEGDVYMAENNNGEIAFTDNEYLYVYNYATGSYKSSNPDFNVKENPIDWPFPENAPGFISFQNGRFIIAANGSTNWVLSDFNNGTSYPNDERHIGSLQTKPDYIQAALPMPGAGNNLLVFGRNVAELWQDIGAAKFPYQRASTFDVDYGCISPASIAALNNYIVWIAVNEQSGPVVMYAIGNQINTISTDGIEFKLGNLTNPTNCTGFLFQQDGHMLYQFTFPDDNLSYAYDFNSSEFFNISDPNLNYHVARQVVYFNNTYYFVRLNGGDIFEFDTRFPDAEYAEDNKQEIPRIRITPPFRIPTQRMFIIKSLGFTIEQGQPNRVENVIVYSSDEDQITTEDGFLIACEDGEIIGTEDTTQGQEIASYVNSEASVYLSISRDGGENFGSSWEMPMNRTGNRKSRFIYQRLGQANDASFQLRFVGLIRFVVTDGVLEIYQ